MNKIALSKTVVKNLLVGAVAASTAMIANAGTLTIESWRVDDKDLWEEVLLPAFNKSHPDIEVKFKPTSPTEYDSSLNARFQGGTAGDLITCRPFDVSLNWYNRGNLAKIDDLAGMKHFKDSAKVAWQTDAGDATYCMPMASVIHGFFYNKEIFAELNLQVPDTQDEFFAVLNSIKAEGSYTPLALGTKDQWEANQIVFTSIGANEWQGEKGRQALLNGSAKFTDAPYVAAWEQMAKWGEYMGKGYQAQSYSDSQNLFALGRAAIYPTGSWDIAYFNGNALAEFGAFKPPVAKKGDSCVISDHTDIGMGINPASKNKAEAEAFLNWLSSAEFADLFTNNVTGFFSLSNHAVKVEDPVANEMISWRNECESTIRLNAQVMNRGEPNMETELWRVSSQVLNGKMTAKQAAAEIQAGFEKWYKK